MARDWLLRFVKCCDWLTSTSSIVTTLNILLPATTSFVNAVISRNSEVVKLVLVCGGVN